ncbi:bifunctional amino acid aminotransferase/2-hydroxyacid dehydrogenase [Lacticaseibacillus chiayiensis]|uniref:Bifunctional amino acid aminotransferase/2-hydroxyacid dehydrogenase n=1 Tax=Lacticaseibacillus chiayiensis TaxID=2100821 RepID=A0A4Q1U5H9_9LACO|nr:D-2-hydroxyacid dehydrogenase [Lacticaseibacillus chiayiensis]QVI34030.1 D-2-hydroxyacid dehydrogenase [Lacticaseibacillus chiayiensis]RXT26789.1 bifunctional amino acid aminotransferase/2-hydroxyacid dehydrogenase [Lacticaseibacillus chiayiensis]RXT59114.1 bifunctional amino acid aminotransferase/2-hydroxyacid dehydrogenase [Lacticaseibacillus chiayiensis]UYN55805.1 D-2-hydroxyacid dehydrogenase [Lacticaseibacillus chiayiensis]
MTKILMYSVRPDEQAAIDAWVATNNIEVDTTTAEFGPKTVDLAKDYDGIVIQQHAAIPEEAVYQKLKSFGIKQLALRITGFDIVNLKAATANGLAVTNVPAYSPRSVSELVLAQVMRLIRHLGEASAREAKDDYSWGGLEAAEIHNLTVGIIGAGKIGSAVARIFRALGSTVIVTDPVKRPELADTVSYVDLDTLLTTADIVTVHTPLDAKTTHLIDANALKKMRSSAYLINAARGPIVDTGALIQSLKDHEIAGAALDTIEGEAGIFGEDRSQSLVDNPELETLKTMPNVEITPHIGFYTDAAVKNMVDISLDDVKLILEGGHSPHQVN